MTTEKQQENVDFGKAELVSYLEENPNIFQQHPELLELVTLADSRGTASLLERQLSMMKERLSEHKSQQSQYMQVARENEQISDSFTRVICQMIGFTNLSQFATEFPSLSYCSSTYSSSGKEDDRGQDTGLFNIESRLASGLEPFR